MTDNEMRIAIAEECGWEKDHIGDWISPTGEAYGLDTDLPDYPNDLNAMAQAEKTLNPDQLYDFFYEKLDEVVQPSGSNFSLSKFHATARQRCEAFLRTVGKWKEPQTVETPIAHQT